MGNGQTLEMASLEWTFVFAFLALEVGCVLLLCIPWPQAFHKYIVRGVTFFVGGKLMTTIKWSFGIVFVLCVDAVRQVYFKYDAMHLEHDEKHEHRGGGLSANLYEKSGKFRAERNMSLLAHCALSTHSLFAQVPGRFRAGAWSGAQSPDPADG